jgi:hypothetical protein
MEKMNLANDKRVRDFSTFIARKLTQFGSLCVGKTGQLVCEGKKGEEQVFLIQLVRNTFSLTLVLANYTQIPRGEVENQNAAKILRVSI